MRKSDTQKGSVAECLRGPCHRTLRTLGGRVARWFRSVTALPSRPTTGRVGMALTMLSLLAAPASAQPSTDGVPVSTPAETSATAAQASGVAAPGSNDSSTAGPSPTQPAASVGVNPSVHSGPYYSGLLQRALGLSPDAPITIGGLTMLGGNWLVSGGLQPQTTTGDLVTAVGAMVDTEKLLHIPGGDIYVSFLNFQGAKNTNTAAGAMTVYDGLTPSSHFSRQELFELYWQKRFFNDKLTVKVGKMMLSSDFLGSGICQPVLIPRGNNPPDPLAIGCYLPWGQTANPTTFGIAALFPNTAWGAIVKFQPTINAYLKYGLFDGNTANGAQLGRNVGPLFSNNYKFHVGEVGYSWLLGEEGKPGQVGAGAWGQTGALMTPNVYLVPNKLLAVQNGATGFYAFATQRLWYQHPGIDPSGIVGFLQFGYTDSLATAVGRYVGGGLTFYGMIPGRERYDQVNIGLGWSRLNPELLAGKFLLPDVPAPYSFSPSLRRSELMMQAEYQLDLIPGILAVQAAYTAIPSPGARPGIPWANAFTVRTTVVW